MALKVSKTFWMGIWCRSAMAAKGKFSWQVSAMSTILRQGKLVVGGELWRERKSRVDKPTYRFGECLRLFGVSCGAASGGEGGGGEGRA